jgi:hypothetical protein
MTVATADSYVDWLLEEKAQEEEEKKRTGKTRYILKDVRIFLKYPYAKPGYYETVRHFRRV